MLPLAPLAGVAMLPGMAALIEPFTMDPDRGGARVLRGLCEYPTELVVALYANIALSLAPKLLHWWKNRDQPRLLLVQLRKGLEEGRDVSAE